ncbi:hypothetical protein CfE428DRAFT_5358 [Chthoniobacter flavus Ellin428]|uniref:Uncharacterized protein n=1 Tax=Chthoniobacter flavus Ellin428 TaxID=497964 RepID=B4D8W8_9BACT|nr:hypothetical protein [Chthoniobacter flavus]EDY17176.1 hypothetical protein CfE428DRAFT_5358 [Chthoniobacter flavus Ellin428]
MNAPHWHLVLNHLPVMGLLFVVLLLGYALVSGRGELYGVCPGGARPSSGWSQLQSSTPDMARMKR